MYYLSASGRKRIATCHPDLVALVSALLLQRDLAVLEGHRDQETQDRYFSTGASKLKFPHGKHNSLPSQAVDMVPCVDGKATYDHLLCLEFGQWVVAQARALGIGLRWGGDWDGDGDRSDQSFDDLVHFELG